MVPEIKNRLPDDARKLVDEVEVASGLEIQVRHAAEFDDHFDSGESGPRGASSVASESLALILYDHSLEGLSDDSFRHELLHLRRYLVERVPQIRPHNLANGNFVSLVENQIEHCFIYKPLFDLADSARQEFVDQTSRAWGRYPWQVGDETRRMYLAVRYFQAMKYGTPDVRRIANTSLSKAKQKLSTQRIYKKLSQAYPDKAKFTREVFNFMKVPTEAFFLRTLDPRRGTFEDRLI